MKTKRTDRRALKRELDAVRAENAALRRRLGYTSESRISTSKSHICVNNDTSENHISTSKSHICVNDDTSESHITAYENTSESHIEAPPILSGGFPVRASPLTAKSLEEAKKIIMDLPVW